MNLMRRNQNGAILCAFDIYFIFIFIFVASRCIELMHNIFVADFISIQLKRVVIETCNKF